MLLSPGTLPESYIHTLSSALTAGFSSEVTVTVATPEDKPLISALFPSEERIILSLSDVLHVRLPSPTSPVVR